MTYIIPRVKLLSPTRYVRDATDAANHAKKRIYILSMVFADHEATHTLIEALKNAARRGIEVSVAADIFTYGEISGGFLPVRYYSYNSRNTKRMVRALKKAGVHFTWLGRGRITLFHGRTHSKWCVIDDTVFTFGGVNLYEGGVHNIDYMFVQHDASLANRLVDEQNRIKKAERTSTNFPSTVYERDAQTDVLIDGGIIGQSVIYSRVIELAEKAKHITFVSQYCPTGKLARILKQTPSTIYYNRPFQAKGLNRMVIRMGQALTGLKTRYKNPRYLHAKCIIFTMKDGSKVALSGSHNFAYTGVLLGTREIALQTSDLSVIAQLERFIDSDVALRRDAHR